jgi:hypothetical protein
MRLRLLALFSSLVLSTGAYAQMNLTGNITPGQVVGNAANPTFTISLIPTGTTSSTVALGNDSRFLNATSINGVATSTLTGIVKFSGGSPSNAAYTDVVALFGSGSCSGYLKSDGTCGNPGGSGTVTSFSSGNLSPLFATSVATSTSTPALSFTLSNAGAHTFLGNNTGTSAAPSYVQPAFSDLSGSVAATQLPNPTTSTLGGVQAYTVVSNQFLTSITSSGVPVSAQPSFANLSGTATGAQLPTPQAAALGGIKSSTAGSNQFSTGVDTTGAVTYAQPSFANLSGSATTGQMPTAVQVWSKYTIPSTSLTSATLSQTVNIVTLTARQLVCGLVEKTTTAFSGNAGGLTLTMGDSNGTSTTYSPSPYDLKGTVSNTNFIANNVLGMASFAGGIVQANFTSASGNLNTVAAGSLDINVCVVTLP